MFSENGSFRRGRELAVVLAALLVGVLLRSEYLRELLLSPFGKHLLLDAEWYDQAARMILAGESPAPDTVYFRPPLYPYFLAGLYRVFGAGLLSPRIVQFALGLVTAVLCWQIARRTHGVAVARLTVILAAAYGMFIYFEAEILTAALGTLLTAAGTLLLLEGDARGTRLTFLYAGLALGLAAITHATALILVLPALLFLLGRRARLGALAFLIGCSLPVGAVTWRNWKVAGEATLIASQGGVNFFIGNNETADGKSALAPGMAEAAQVLAQDGRYHDTMEIAARTLAERRAGRSLTAAQVSRFWYREGFRWIAEHPRAAFVLFLRKLVFFANGYEISNNRDLHDQARRFTPLLGFFLVQSAFLLPLAFYGMIRGGVRGRGRLLLLGCLVTYALAIAAFFVCARFRQPAFVWLLPFAAAGIVAFARDVAHARTDARRFAFSCLLLVILFAATNARTISGLRIADVSTEVDAPAHRFNLAVLYERSGDLDRAIAEYREAAASGVRDPRVHLNLGNLLSQTGRLAEARMEYHRVLEIDPSYEGAVCNNLGILAAQQEDWEEAIRQFEACLAADAPGTNVLGNLGMAYLRTGRLDDAIVAFRRVLSRSSGNEVVWRRNLALAYLENGLLEDAEKEALLVLGRAPADVATVLMLGKIYARQGKADSAERMWVRAQELAPGAPAVQEAIRAARSELEH
jgi:Tfp pilus assembly protein PilF